MSHVNLGLRATGLSNASLSKTVVVGVGSVTSYKMGFSLFVIVVCLNHTTHADDGENAEEAASYFESFYAQTADWGDIDVEIVSSFLKQGLDSGKLSERSVRERFVRFDDKGILVRSIRRIPISGDDSAKPSHELTVSVLFDKVALQRTFPSPTNRFVLTEKDRTFEWVCNPIDFRLMGLITFPFRDGTMPEEMAESLRRALCSPDPARTLALRNGQAVVSQVLRKSEAVSQASYTFDIDRLLMTQRQWKLEAPERLHQGKETYQWKKIDGAYRPTKLIGETLKLVPEGDKRVRQLEQFEAEMKWRKTDKSTTENPKELLDDPKKALEFIGVSEHSTNNEL